MGSVHQLPTDADTHARLLEQLVSELIEQHPDPQIAKRWAAMARETLAQYPAPPTPSQTVLDLDQVEGLSQDQQAQLHSLTQSWLLSYFNDVRGQLLNVHRDFLLLQKRIAELELKGGDS
ncbi:MAG: hypothetical protein AB8B79_03095 [Granulosicoccus sp.]